jgi:DNA-binding Lrp family transcriptional regulator
LKYLEDDARKSLKKLADDMKKKTSTIYHRLQRLKSRNFILGYSIIFNPEYLNIEKISMEKIILKPLNISSLDNMFVKSFANFINTEFPQVLMIALSENGKTINLISAHITTADHTKFIETLRNNPYIERIETEFFSQFVKGQKLFTFNEQWIKRKARTKKVADEEGEEEDDGTMEIQIDDEDEVEGDKGKDKKKAVEEEDELDDDEIHF